MAVTITTEYKANAKGEGRITAKGRGKQRTMPYNHALGVDANHAQAAGVLGNVILDARQQSMVHHPSFRNKWSMDAPENGKRVIVLPV
jgi:hypothetical protein